MEVVSAKGRVLHGLVGWLKWPECPRKISYVKAIDQRRSRVSRLPGGNSLSSQQAPASFDKNLRTHDDVGIAGVFVPVMTNASDRRHNSMPAGMIVARTWASWPAPLGMRMNLPSARTVLTASIAS